MENPVYYVQYAHARIASIGRKAAERGRRARGRSTTSTSSLLAHERELELLRALARVPRRASPRRPSCARRRRSRTWVRDFATRVPRLLPRLPGAHRRRRAHPGPAVAGRGVPDRARQRARRSSACSAPDEMARLDDDDDDATSDDRERRAVRPDAAARVGAGRRRRRPVDRRRRPRRRSPTSSARRSTSTTRTSCARGAASTATRSAPARRVREQGVPLHRDGAARRRGGSRTSTSRPAASCTSRCTPGSRPSGIVFHGNNKSDAELRAALERGRRPHRRRLVRRARPPRGARRGAAAPRRACWCASRPGVEAHTHEFIETGTDDSKFGFRSRTATRSRAVQRVVDERRAASFAGLALPHRLAGVPARLVRSARSTDGRRSCRRSRATTRRDRRGAEPRRRARRALPRRATTPPSIARVRGARCSDAFAQGARRRTACGRGPTLMVEPGRSIAAPAGVTLYTRRHDQGDPRRAHLRRGRRRHERQPAAGHLRRAATRRSSRRGPTAPRPLRGRRSRASTASRATCSCATRTCPPTSRSATCSPRRSPAPTATRWRRNYNKVPRPAVVFVRDGVGPARRAPRDLRRPRAARRAPMSRCGAPVGAPDDGDGCS